MPWWPAMLRISPRTAGMRFLHIMFLPSHLILTAILFLVGYLGWDAYTGWPSSFGGCSCG